MPWTIADVDNHKKGLGAEQKKKWVKIANSALTSCIENGGTDDTCAPRAIRIANSQFNIDEVAWGSFQEIKDTDEFQLILPIGHWYHALYGEFDITQEICKDMVANWEAKVLGERTPYIDTDHDGGAANGWIKGLEAKEKGLYARIEWTEPGKELLRKGMYKYFSAEIGDHMDIHTGLKVKNVLAAATLTNRPFMNTMPQAHLNSGITSTHRDRAEINILNGRTEMTFQELKEAILGLDSKQKDEIVKAMDISHDDSKQTEMTENNRLLVEQVDVLKDTNKKLAANITVMETKELSKRKEAVITLALQEGRILPADKEKWEKRFDSQADFTEEILKEQPKIVDLVEHGTAGPGSEIRQFSAEELKVMKALDLTEKEFIAQEAADKAAASEGK